MQQHDMPLPADINAERATLGAILLERDAIIGVAGWLTPDHFYLEKHAWIYDAMLACYRRRTPPDVTTVASTLRSHALQRHAAGAEEDPPRHRLDLVGGIAYLGELSAEPVLPSHIEYYARHIYDTAALRQLVVCGGKITALGYDERRELGEIINSARSLIETVERRRECPRGTPARELLTLDLPPVRWIVPGLISEGFGYLAARPGTGKTWLLLQIAAAVASGTEVLGIETTTAPVLYLALEDSASSLQERVRMVCKAGDVPEDLITYHEDSGWRPLSDGGLQQIENAIIEHQARLVIIDTLTALAPDAPRGTNPYRAEYQSLLPIRHLADRLSVGIIGSWHFNKAGAHNVLEMTSGTMGMPAVSINRIGMVRDDDSPTARLKSYPKRGKELDLILSFDPDTCVWTAKGSTTAVWQSEQRRAVLVCIEESGGTADIKTLLHATDMRYNNLIQLLRAMHADGQVRRTKKRGVYTINTDEDTQEVMIS